MRKRFHRDSSGQSLLEFALLLPLMFLLVVNVVNFGGLLYAYITVTNAARSGATYMMMGPSSVGNLNLPSTAAVQDIVQKDLASLPRSTNSTVTTVTVCGNFNGTTTWQNSSGTQVACTMPSNPPSGTSYADPQPTLNNMGVVQVQYTYCPFIGALNFPQLGIYTTLPSCKFTSGNLTNGGTRIDRRAAVRLLQ
jgi:Flp pilus assembly protein TadG